MFGTTIGNTYGSVFGTSKPNSSLESTAPPVDDGVKRSINYIADYGGCGHWRVIWPSSLLNAHQRHIVHSNSSMITSPEFYRDITSVRLQRQVTSYQQKFFEFLESANKDMHIMYDIDDVFIYEDIPGYNKFRAAYRDPAIKETGLSIMKKCSEVTVTCNYMKEYYEQYVDHVTVIPNYMPKFWMDRYYDEVRLAKNYDRNVKKRKKPRVLYAASGAHFDVTGQNKYVDDFSHISDVVRNTVNDIQWVLLGAYPIPLRDLVTSGKIEFVHWKMIPDYPDHIHSLKINLAIAPLMDNTFNKCKSDLKFIESGAFGIPCICQDLITYNHAHYKFTTGDELIDQIKALLKDKPTYLKACRKAREYANTRWLEDHIDLYDELYKFPRGSDKRKQLNLLQQNNTI
jgi:O-antigen biosynthesis protein